MSVDYRIGVDLGGTKIEAVLLDSHHQVLWRERQATPQGDYSQTLATIEHLLQQMAAAFPIAASLPVGIGAPGALDKNTGRVKNANSTCLNGKRLLVDCEQQLRRSVRIANDANCFALAESVIGAAKGAHSVFGVILGTGVGGGIVLNQQLLLGHNRIGGEWGHIQMPAAGCDSPPRPCYCGLKDCVETYLSGPGLSETFYRLSGLRWQAEDIAIACGNNEALALKAWDQYVNALGIALAQVINIIDPEVVVLGGGVSNVESIYQQLPERWLPWIFSDRVETRLVKATLGDSAGVFGAAWLW